MNPNWENEGNDGQDNNTHDPMLLLERHQTQSFVIVLNSKSLSCRKLHIVCLNILVV